MEYFELCEKRSSYRGDYTSKKISIQDIKLILSAALNAPTGCNAQSTQFVVVSDDDILEKISKIVSMPMIGKASAAILCIVNKEPINIIGDMSFEIEDCAAAVMSMLLAITELGYASVWIDGRLRTDDNADKIAELINLPSNKKIQILLPVGQATETVEQPPKKLEAERVSFNTYLL